MRMIDIFMLAVLTFTLFVFSEETLLHSSHGGPEEDGCETYKCEGGGDDDRTVLYWIVDTQHETKGHCTTDDACIGDKDQIAESNAWLVASKFE